MERDIVLGILRVVSPFYSTCIWRMAIRVVLARHWLYILPILPLGIGYYCR